MTPTAFRQLIMNTLSVLCLLSTLVATADAVRCYHCLGIDHPENCTNLKECPSPTMFCHGRQYIAQHKYKYDLDCKPSTVCGVLLPSDDQDNPSEVDLWESCCQGSYCNKYFDAIGNIIPLEMRVYYCYTCTGVTDPQNCQHTKKCQKGEVCFTREIFTNDGRELFDMDCLPRDTCLLAGFHLPFGKRRVMCQGCCDQYDNCNNQFCSKLLGAPTLTALGTSFKPLATSRTTSASTTNIHEKCRPVITEGPRNQVVHLNQPVRLQCKVAGIPAPTVQWIFMSPSGSRLIPAGTTINLDDSVDIPSMTTDHVGTWTCVASNTHGHDQASAIIGIK